MISSILSPSLKSVNFHFWQPCNLRCKFCFAQFQDVKQEMRLPKGHLPQADHLAIIRQLAAGGTQKITFVGGEPTLCAWLPNLIQEAKTLGMTTMIVTNGTRLNAEYLRELQDSLDWITLSIDSLQKETLQQIGRWNHQQFQQPHRWYRELVELIHRYGFQLKINTVVCQPNWQEDLTEFIQWTATPRWKIFQALPVEGQNDAEFAKMAISGRQFKAFIARHQVELGQVMVVENNEAMSGSYVMIDPAGRFFDNVGGKHHYSPPILEIGIDRAMSEVTFSETKFRERDGEWAW